MKQKRQYEIVLDLLKKHKELTQELALNEASVRHLARRIRDLKVMGHIIDKTMKPPHDKPKAPNVAYYYLIKEALIPMSINRYDKKRDANEREIIDVFEAFGFSVVQIDIPCDLIVGLNGINYLIEVKDGSKAKLTKNQVKFSKSWKGHYEVIRSFKDATDWCDKKRCEVIK